MEIDNTNGDANGDGLVNGEDLAVWEGLFASLAAAAAVAEPQTAALLLLGVATGNDVPLFPPAELANEAEEILRKTSG